MHKYELKLLYLLIRKIKVILYFYFTSNDHMNNIFSFSASGYFKKYCSLCFSLSLVTNGCLLFTPWNTLCSCPQCSQD